MKKVPVPPVVPPPPPTAPLVAKRANSRCSLTSVPTIRRNDAHGSVASRSKCEIHPPPKDLPYANTPKNSQKARASKDDINAEQLKFCGKILADLHRKMHCAIASPFYEPVGEIHAQLPALSSALMIFI